MALLVQSFELLQPYVLHRTLEEGLFVELVAWLTELTQELEAILRVVRHVVHVWVVQFVDNSLLVAQIAELGDVLSLHFLENLISDFKWF